MFNVNRFGERFVYFERHVLPNRSIDIDWYFFSALLAQVRFIGSTRRSGKNHDGKCDALSMCQQTAAPDSLCPHHRERINGCVCVFVSIVTYAGRRHLFHIGTRPYWSDRGHNCCCIWSYVCMCAHLGGRWGGSYQQQPVKPVWTDRRYADIGLRSREPIRFKPFLMSAKWKSMLLVQGTSYCGLPVTHVAGRVNDAAIAACMELLAYIEWETNRFHMLWRSLLLIISISSCALNACSMLMFVQSTSAVYTNFVQHDGFNCKCIWALKGEIFWNEDRQTNHAIDAICERGLRILYS